ncbi:acetyl-CoA carboxylase biotin carboxylase subunit [Corynebacterium epidermidicanis]|uniref:biotin carboxylase n=1 Tax=Corynebacterium epidermidicanis TaxID=1050174 RepID=A0A0G3GQ27_9CORY|nr:acetyl/propionyl/methylcrotonyl-CoA carboxylase subunit alpha [Corynebacterium epidermidicanis]AKK02655.1 acetyl/propionyl-CoA carboxylase, alpha subunit [Corynebacterium epidermidicanis]
MFHTVLVANRGEIACRVIRTLREQGIKSVAVYSDADRTAPHVQLADTAVHIGPAPARESYLVIDTIIDAAKKTGAQAIHPGYGFLSENADFAHACEAAGIEFIGPPASAIEVMGDKISARAAVEKREVPTVPGISRPGLSDDDIIAAAPGIGFPVLIKPSAGGGGKGMHRVETPEELPERLQAARREAAGAFGDDTLFLEHFVDTPRHIEVQVMADKHGNVIHFGERECSLQRRHQKVIEEAPSPLLDEETRAAIGQAACDAARSVGYVGAGTVEFIVPSARPDQFFFMEMNTRLQVEHPVTEEVTGVDLVALQLAVAAGEKLPLAQEDVTLTGHAIEARIYAEDAAQGFLPTGGTIKRVTLPTGAGIRVDSGITDGSEITSLYDPMLMKVIAHGANREEALSRLDDALAHTHIAGFTVNTEFCRFLLSVPEVAAGDLDTGLLDRVSDNFEPAKPNENALIGAAMVWLASRWPEKPTSAWAIPDAWRAGRTSDQKIRLASNGEDFLIAITGTPSDAQVSIDGEAAVPAAIFRVGDAWNVHIDGIAHACSVADLSDGEFAHVVLTDATGSIEFTRKDAVLATSEDADGGDKTLVSPMPGTVIAHAVAPGTAVAVGDAVVIVEAMKMEHTLRAAVDGVVTFHVEPGEQVPAGKPLATVEPQES